MGWLEGQLSEISTDALPERGDAMGGKGEGGLYEITIGAVLGR